MAPWREVLDEVVCTRRPALVGYAYLFTSNRRDAEDLVHDALLRVFARERRLTDAGSAEAYVRATIRTTFLDGARRQRTWRSKVHLLATDAETVASPEVAVGASIDVRAALAALPPRQRACVVLRFFDDLPVDDIARQLGLSPGAVKRYLFEGTAAMRRALGPDAVPADRSRIAPSSHPQHVEGSSS